MAWWDPHDTTCLLNSNHIDFCCHPASQAPFPVPNTVQSLSVVISHTCRAILVLILRNNRFRGLDFNPVTNSVQSPGPIEIQSARS